MELLLFFCSCVNFPLRRRRRRRHARVVRVKRTSLSSPVRSLGHDGKIPRVSLSANGSLRSAAEAPQEFQDMPAHQPEETAEVAIVVGPLRTFPPKVVVL